MHPDQAIDRAVALRGEGRGEEAVELLRGVLRRHPRDPRLWQTLGTVHRALEQSAAAIAAFAEAARLAPSDVRAQHGVAQASLEAGRPASQLFERLATVASADGSVLLGHAAALLAEGRGSDAVARLDAVVAINPLWLDGQATLARLRWQLGDTAGFAKGYTRALAAHPRDPSLWFALVDLLIHVEQFATAREVVSRAIAATGQQDALLPFAAMTASETGDVAGADAAFARLAGRSDAWTIEQHVRHLLRRGRADEAVRRLEPALASDLAVAAGLWPYAAVAWRLAADPRADWLDGDPALVGSYELDLDLPALAARLRTLHVAKRDPLGQSVRGGTQTDGPLFALEAPEIQAARRAVLAAVERHAAALGPVDRKHPTRRHVGKRLRFAGSWSVRLLGAGHHSAHVHPQGWLSSALYVSLPTAGEMGPAPAGWLQVGQPPASLNVPLEPQRRIEPRPGRLVLFPSWMWHGTEPIAAGERLTIAFDVAPWR